MYNVEKSKAAQRARQQEKGLPDFAPTTGICWACNKNIYMPQINRWDDENYFVTGIDKKRAGEELITGCPHCNQSYVD